MITRQSTDTIVIHCAATKPTMDVGVEEITDWHKQRGFDTIGYHYVIRRSGQIEEGRSDELEGAHAVRVNGTSIGICLVGGVTQDDHTIPEDNFTKEQWAELNILLEELIHTFPEVKVIGHNQISHKDCPSFDVQTYLKDKSFKESGCKEPLS